MVMLVYLMTIGLLFGIIGLLERRLHLRNVKIQQNGGGLVEIYRFREYIKLLRIALADQTAGTEEEKQLMQARCWYGVSDETHKQLVDLVLHGNGRLDKADEHDDHSITSGIPNTTDMAGEGQNEANPNAVMREHTTSGSGSVLGQMSEHTTTKKVVL
jgi:hypothetical protein